MNKTLEQFFNSLSDEEAKILTSYMARHTVRAPLDRESFMRLAGLGVGEPATDDPEITAAHQAAIKARDEALARLGKAQEALERARSQRVQMPSGLWEYSDAQRAEIERLEIALEDAQREYDRLAQEEVAARPYNAGKVRRPRSGAFAPFARILGG